MLRSKVGTGPVSTPSPLRRSGTRTSRGRVLPVRTVYKPSPYFNTTTPRTSARVSGKEVPQNKGVVDKEGTDPNTITPRTRLGPQPTRRGSLTRWSPRGRLKDVGRNRGPAGPLPDRQKKRTTTALSSGTEYRTYTRPTRHDSVQDLVTRLS